MHISVAILDSVFEGCSLFLLLEKAFVWLEVYLSR